MHEKCIFVIVLAIVCMWQWGGMRLLVAISHTTFLLSPLYRHVNGAGS